VKTRDHLGNLTTVTPTTTYRLRSSLDAAGAVMVSKIDYLDIVSWSNGLSGPDIFDPWRWPRGTQAVQVTGNFGWTVTPYAAKRAVALMVYDRLKPIRADFRMAERVTTADSTQTRGTTFPSGIPEADDIIYDLRRTTPTVLVS
jgi:hypothetical protein